MSGHTPGPWEYQELGQQIWAKSIGGCKMEESRFMVADIRGWGHLQYLPNGEEIQDANARLISAAPDLLEALNAIVEYWDSVVPLECINDHHKMARAAIAKAISK